MTQVRGPFVWAVTILFLLLPVLLLARPPEAGARVTATDDGIVRSMPERGLVGSWVVGSKSFQVTQESEFGEEAPYVGACVSIGYNRVNGRNVVDRMELSDDCEGAGERSELFGIVESFPPTLSGEWIIDGTGYSARETTVFEQAAKPFATGSCVQVVFLVEQESNLALRISTRHRALCTEQEEGPENVVGNIDNFPPAPYSGTWTIEGVSYRVSDQTRLDQRRGGFYAGACVEVLFDPSSPQRAAYAIMSQVSDECGGAVEPPPDAEEGEVIGAITHKPEGLFGQWQVGELTVEARRGESLFDFSYGALQIGGCAGLSYYVEAASGTKVALEIESESSLGCGQPDETHESYGVIRALPSTSMLTGTWTIGGLNYLVTGETELEDGPFTPGLLVEVRYTRTADRTLIAHHIEGEHDTRQRGQGDGKLYGPIESLPPSTGLTGTWRIGGTDYQVTADTRLESGKGPFQVGSCVALYYQMGEENRLLALKIESEDSTYCETEPDTGETLARTFGFVEQLPPSGFVGSWLISGVPYEAHAATNFQETHGILLAGAFVEVAYRIEGGIRVAERIVTHVPPGAGEQNASGVASFREEGTTLEVPGILYLNGQSYLITRATFVNELAGALREGQRVQVNGYQESAEVTPLRAGREASQSFIATRVTTLESAHLLYLPAVTNAP